MSDSAATKRFVCPRGHSHYEASAFCTVCGAGPVLEDRFAAQDLLDLARLLLTPGARLTDEDNGRMDEWVKGRIRWHRLDGNDELADKLLREENSQREALGKELLDA